MKRPAERSPLASMHDGLEFVDALTEALSKFGDLPAVYDSNGSVTYTELHRMARNIQAHLEDQREPGTPVVAVITRASALSIAAVLGVLLSGRAYLPLDPQASTRRLDSTIKEAGAGSILSSEAIRQVTGQEREARLPARSKPSSPAAVLFTSATTGSSKGVVLSHRCILFHSLTYRHHMQIGPGDRVSLFAPMHVGASVSNIFGCLLSGACLYPFAARDRDTAELLDELRRHDLSVVHMVPSLFRRLARGDRSSDSFSSVHHLKLGGEPVTSLDVELFRNMGLGGTRLMNGLGITEAGGNVTFGEVQLDVSATGPVSMGAPVEGVIAQIDTSNRDLDEAGELVVTSPYLGSGYLGEANGSAFKTSDGGSVSLRTGDVVGRDAAGDLFHIGRIDQIVNISGVRIALPELEAALKDVTGIDDAAVDVVAGTANQPILCGIVAGSSPPSVAHLRSALTDRIGRPEIPVRFYHTDLLPEGTGGKAGWSRLEELIESIDLIRDQPMRSPSTSLEAGVLAIWEEVLNLTQIGVDDPFQDVGGDSIRAAQILTTMNDRFQIHISLEQFYRCGTIARLAAAVEDGSWSEFDHPAVVLRAGEPEQTIFLFPGAGSDVVALWELAHALPTGLRVVGFQYPGLDGESPYKLTVEELARHFVDHLVHHQPQGPYRLAGSSFGGLVAFELSRLLEATGEHVSFLGLLDTYAPGYLAFGNLASPARLKKALRYWLMPVTSKHVWNRQLVKKGIREKLRLAKAWLGLRVPLGILRPYRDRFHFLMQASFTAARRFEIRPVNAAVTVFRAEQTLPSDLFTTDDWLGWKEASRSTVRTVPIPGYHGSHIRHPNVETLAEILHIELARTQ
jgi:acyl-coenzyme A synthetase/AMP-(fatty) acid ligase/thioesterase domain-containing protein/acyl carrier protein